MALPSRDIGQAAQRRSWGDRHAGQITSSVGFAGPLENWLLGWRLRKLLSRRGNRLLRLYLLLLLWWLLPLQLLLGYLPGCQLNWGRGNILALDTADSQSRE